MHTEESEYKTKLVAQCRRMGAYARRFEDRYGVGVLDVIAIFHNFPVCFVEGKIIRSNTFGPTERQWVEGQRLLKLQGGFTLPVLVGWDQNRLMHVGEWARALPIKACNQQIKGEDYAETLWRFMDDFHKPRSG